MDGTGGQIAGDVGLYLGDLEVYIRQPGTRQLPPRAGVGGELRAVVFREAESKFPARAWGKYDLNVTYSRAAQVTYGYLDDFDLFLAEAAAAVSGQEQNTETATVPGLAPASRPDLVGAVILRCGIKGAGGQAASADRRRMRAVFVQELARLVPVKSYGECANTAAWVPGRAKDKAWHMRRAKFCVAYENALDADYVTEKLYDCLRAGSIPLVSGGAHIRDLAPPGSCIFIDDFESVSALAEHLQALAGDPVLMAQYHAWIREHTMPGWEAWRDRMRAIEASAVRCRLCQFVAGMRGGGTEDLWSAKHLASVRAQRSRAAAAVGAAEEARRRGLAHASNVRVEL